MADKDTKKKGKPIEEELDENPETEGKDTGENTEERAEQTDKDTKDKEELSVEEQVNYPSLKSQACKSLILVVLMPQMRHERVDYPW